MAKIIAVCTSEKVGIRKQPVPEATIEENYGLTGDAHANSASHRQVSLLAIESINKMQSQGYDVNPGDFAENLTTEGIDLVKLPIGTEVLVGKDTVLSITQIGKDCHTGCAIFRAVGKCIMPKEGVFARVIHGGTVQPGDQIRELKKDAG